MSRGFQSWRLVERGCRAEFPRVLSLGGQNRSRVFGSGDAVCPSQGGEATTGVVGTLLEMLAAQ